MIVVIFGSRYKDARPTTRSIVQSHVYARVSQLPPDAYVITGGAGGVDTWAENARKALGLDGDVIRAKWRDENGVYNVCAGFERNDEMLDLGPELAIGFWDGKSSGTKHTRDSAERRGIELEMYEIPA